MTFDKGELPSRDGQMVEVVLRGPVSRITDSCFHLGPAQVWLDFDFLVSVETLPDPLVPWLPGDVIRDSGTSYVRGEYEWRGYPNPGHGWPDSEMDRSVARGAAVLIRGGVLVTPAGADR